MTAIAGTHAEWAVVDRLRALLDEPEHPRYNVTQAYGLCVAILAWVMQRIRTPECQADSPEALAAIAMCKHLEQQDVGALPWGLKTSGHSPQTADHEDFKGFSAFEFLKWLRDATCHGDARNVSPINVGASLVGFRIRMKAHGDRVRALTLTERDLRRIGHALAHAYCDALKSAASKSPDDFVLDAGSIRERGEAA